LIKVAISVKGPASVVESVVDNGTGENNG
jgi:hypothetical protein